MMWFEKNVTPVPPLHNRNKIENIIDQSLLGDWAIRIEYCGINAQGQTGWVQWGSTIFAIRSPEQVMEAIDACHASYPAHEIRIHAEKFQPEMRMVFSVFNPPESGLIDEVPVAVSSEAANQKWPWSAKDPVPGGMASTWRFVAASGALAGALVILGVVST